MFLFKIMCVRVCIYKQRSRDRWLSEGDRNTKYFHAKASTRRRFNRIQAIVARGITWEDKRDVEREIVNFYQTLYSSDNHFRPKLGGISFSSLSRDQANLLERSFSIEEIKEVVDGMAGDRAPSSDGFPIALFQFFWNDIKEDLFLQIIPLSNQT